jgi:hypothetical protein
MMMIEETAKGRCALSSLTPGCLSNADISGWRARIGHRSMIMNKASDIEKIIAAATAAKSALAAESAKCGFLNKSENWLIGDPGAPLKTSIWIPRACLDTVHGIIDQIAAEEQAKEKEDSNAD